MAMNTKKRKKWVIAVMFFLLTPWTIQARERQSRQNASNESGPPASSSRASSPRQDRSFSRTESAVRSQPSVRSAPSSRPAPVARSGSAAVPTPRVSRPVDRTVRVAEKTTPKTGGGYQGIRPAQRSVEVSQPRSQRPAVSSPVKTEPMKIDRAVPALPRKTEPVKIEPPAKIQPEREVKRTPSPVVSESARTDRLRLEPKERTAPVERTERISRPASPLNRTDRPEGQTNAAKDSDKASPDRAGRFTRDDLKDRAQRTSPDQIRDGSKSGRLSNAAEPVKSDSSAKTQPEREAKRTAGPVVSESARTDHTRLESKERTAPAERTERISRPASRPDRTDRPEGQTSAAKDSDKAFSDRAGRSRDDLKDRTQRVRSDQIREGYRGGRLSEANAGKEDREKTRSHVVTRIDRSDDRSGRRPEDRSGREEHRPGIARRESSTSPMAGLSQSRGNSDRVGRDFRPQTRRDFSGRHISRAEDYDSRVVVNGSNNVVLLGNVTKEKPLPYIPRTLHRGYDYVRHSRGWVDCGSYFSLSFSLNSCGRLAYVPYGNYFGFTYYYPRYHRRYVFVSLGGWWPSDYRYVRYYWYGWHPYYWYGPTVIYPYTYPAVKEYNTYNTYNYYQTAPAAPSATEEPAAWKYPFGNDKYDAGSYIDKISTVDKPEFETAADLCFAQAVDLFEAGMYAEAAAQFREALQVSPDDIILPFTYSQALFANEEYARAAAVLRSALAAIPDDQLTIYYPRGLYDKEEYLIAQIEALEKIAQAEPFAGDYNLLLGYQYLGLGQIEKAAEPLAKAAQDPANEQAAAMLIELAAKIQETPTEQ